MACIASLSLFGEAAGAGGAGAGWGIYHARYPTGAFGPLDGDGWALEGLGILWLGVQQQQRRMSYSGTALLVLAVCSALWAQMNGMSALSLVLIFAVLSLSWLAAAAVAQYSVAG